MAPSKQKYMILSNSMTKCQIPYREKGTASSTLEKTTKSRLMDLPGELRNKILDNCVISEESIPVTFNTWRIGHDPFRGVSYRSLALVSKKFYEEASFIFYSKNTFDFRIRDSRFEHHRDYISIQVEIARQRQAHFISCVPIRNLGFITQLNLSLEYNRCTKLDWESCMEKDEVNGRGTAMIDGYHHVMRRSSFEHDVLPILIPLLGGLKRIVLIEGDVMDCGICQLELAARCEEEIDEGISGNIRREIGLMGGAKGVQLEGVFVDTLLAWKYGRVMKDLVEGGDRVKGLVRVMCTLLWGHGRPELESARGLTLEMWLECLGFLEAKPVS